MAISEESKYDLHVMICNNKRGPDYKGSAGPGCGAMGADELKNKVKEAVKEIFSDPALRNGKKLRVNTSGCLGACADGIACVAYPKSSWMLKVTSQDTELLTNWVKDLLNDKEA